MTSTPEDFNIHDPAWWARDDAAFDAQLDHYDGVPTTEEVRANLLMMAWAEIARLRVVARTLAVEGHPKRVHNPRRRGDGADSHIPQRVVMSFGDFW